MRFFNIALIVVFLACLALMGLGSSQPQIVVPCLLVFFALVFWVTYAVIRRQQKQSGDQADSRGSLLVRRVLSIIGWIIMLGSLALVSTGSDKSNIVVPMMFVFYLVVFALVYLGVRKSGVSVSDSNKDERGFFHLLKVVGMVLGWLILLVALSMSGAGSANKQAMIPALFVFFLLVFIGVFLYTRKHSHLEAPNPKTTLITHRISGTILLAIAILTPLQVVKTVTGQPVSKGILIGLGALLVFLGGLAVMMITRGYRKGFTAAIPGYVILILVNLIPGWAVAKLGEASFSSIGSAYFGVLFMAVIAWWGATLYRNPEAE